MGSRRGLRGDPRRWLTHAAGIGGDIEVRLPDRELTGTFESLDRNGAADAAPAGRRARSHHGRRSLQPRRASARPDGARPNSLFAPLGGVGEIGMNLALYGLGDGRQAATGSRSISASSFAGDELPGIDLIMPDIALPDRGAAQSRSASCSRTRMRIISARCSTCGRGCAARSTRRRSPPRCSRPSAQGEPGALGRAGQGRAARRPLHARAVRRRARLGGAFDPGIERADHPHAARQRAAHRRLEARSDAGHRPADRRGEAARARRRGLPRADRRLHQRGARRPLALGSRRRARRCAS